jgi:hypothetical protein
MLDMNKILTEGKLPNVEETLSEVNKRMRLVLDNGIHLSVVFGSCFYTDVNEKGHNETVEIAAIKHENTPNETWYDFEKSEWGDPAQHVLGHVTPIQLANYILKLSEEPSDG